VRIAIVGSGVSGLVAAHLLHRHHDVAVFEADDRIGGHAHTVDVGHSGRRLAVDTGFIVYNESTYPAFTRLLSEIGVASRPSDMSFGFHCEATGLEWASRDWGAIFAQRANVARPGFWRMLLDIRRFNLEARADEVLADPDLALGDYLEYRRYSRRFVDDYVVPMGAAIWSADPKEFLRFPARSFVHFFDNHGLMDRPSPVSWRVVEGGSRSYVDALVAPFRERIRTSHPVESVERRSEGVRLHLGDGRRETFDRVVLAVHSDQALRMLARPSPLEAKILGAIRYQTNEAVLHVDPSLMPRRRAAWASWNYLRVGARSGEAPRPVCVTYHMNRLQGFEAPADFFVTLDPEDRVAPEREIARFTYHHPVFDAAALRAQRLHDEIDGANRTHFCGAYWGHGFHEDGVQSGIRVARKLGAKW